MAAAFAATRAGLGADAGDSALATPARTPTAGAYARGGATRSPSTIPRRFSRPAARARTRRSGARPARPAARWHSRCSASLRGGRARGRRRRAATVDAPRAEPRARAVQRRPVGGAPEAATPFSAAGAADAEAAPRRPPAAGRDPGAARPRATRCCTESWRARGGCARCARTRNGRRARRPRAPRRAASASAPAGRRAPAPVPAGGRAGGGGRRLGSRVLEVRGSRASTRSAEAARRRRARADAHRRGASVHGAVFPSAPPASWRWRVGLTHRARALAARGDAAGAARGAARRRGGGRARAAARARAVAETARDARATPGDRPRRSRGGARGARRRARRRGGASAPATRAGAAGPGVRRERRRAASRRTAPSAGGGARAAAPSRACRRPGDIERARARRRTRSEAGAPSESARGNGCVERDGADENEPRGAPGGGPLAAARARALGMFGAERAPRAREATGPARVRGAPRCSRSKSRFAARLPRAAGRPRRRAARRWASCSPPSPPTRARAPATPRSISSDFFRALEGPPAARHGASAPGRLGRARAAPPHTAPSSAAPTGPEGTRADAAAAAAAAGAARAAPTAAAAARRGSPLRRLGVARARARPRAVPQMYHQTRARKRPSRECARLACRVLGLRGRVAHTSRSLPASPSRARRRRRLLWPPPPRPWRCPGPTEATSAEAEDAATRAAGADVSAAALGGSWCLAGGGSRRTPRTLRTAAPSRERERGAAARRNRAGKRRTHSHNLCCGATPLGLQNARRAAGAGGGASAEGPPPRAGTRECPARARVDRGGAPRDRSADAAESRARRRRGGCSWTPRGTASARGSHRSARGLRARGETKPNEPSPPPARAARRRRAGRDTIGRDARRDPSNEAPPLAAARARACSRRSNLCPRATGDGAPTRPLARAASALETEGGADALETAAELRDACAARRAAAASRARGRRRVPLHRGGIAPTSARPRCAVLEPAARVRRRAPPSRAAGGDVIRRRRAAAAQAQARLPETGGGARPPPPETRLQTKYTRADAARPDDARRLRRALDALRATWRGLLRAVDPNASLAAYLPRRAFAGVAEDGQLRRRSARVYGEGNF